MRYHGKASISSRSPRALAICDRCGFQYNHVELDWQQEWRGPRLQPKPILVCKTCLDIPQEQFRTIILPADPVGIPNPRPDAFDRANNSELVPITSIRGSTTIKGGGTGNLISVGPGDGSVGLSAQSTFAGGNIGTLTGGGGTYSAFVGSSNKPFKYSANLLVSGSSFTNWVGKDWQAAPNASFLPATINSTGLALVAEGFGATAPNDQSFLGNVAANWAFQGSADAINWTTLASGTTAGTKGENINSASLSGQPYRYHRFVVAGDAATAVAVAQLTINTNRGINLV